MHKVLAHNSNYDDVFFVYKFIDGLKGDIRAAIVLHKPRTVDDVLSLALLQQEELVTLGRRHYCWQEHKEYHKFNHKPQTHPGKGVLGVSTH